MAKKISYTDSLRQGTDKINNYLESNETTANQAKNTADKASNTANEAKITADGAVNTAVEAKDQAQSTQNQLDTVIIESGTSDAEVIQARGSYSILNDRLVDTDEKLSTVTYNMSALTGDGVVDDRTALQNLITTAKNNKVKKLKIPKGTYRLDSILFVSGDNIELDFSGSTILSYAKASSNSMRATGIINVHGELIGDRTITQFISDTTVPPTESPDLLTLESVSDNGATARTSRITTSNNDYFTIGDEVLIVGWTRTTLPYSASSFDPTLRTIANVVDKDATYIYIDYVSPIDYPAFVNSTEGRSSVSKINTLKNVSIKNLTIIDMVDLATENAPTDTELNEALSGISTLLTKNYYAENIRVEKHKYPACYEQFNYGLRMKNIEGHNPQMWEGGKGYVIHSLSSRNLEFDNIYGNGCRHVVDFSASSNGVAKNSHGVNSKAYDFKTHGMCEHDIKFENCRGSLKLAAGLSSFPNISFNVSTHKSNLHVSMEQDAYINDLIIRDSDIYAYRIPPALNLHVLNSRVSVPFASIEGTTSINDRGLGKSAKLDLNGSNVTFVEYPSTFETMSLIGYNEIVMNDVGIYVNFDFSSLQRYPYLELRGSEHIELNNVRATDISFRIDPRPSSTLKLTTKDCVMKYDTNKASGFVFYVTNVENCFMVYDIKGSTIKTGISNTGQIYPHYFGTQTSSELVGKVKDNFMIGNAAESVVLNNVTGTWVKSFEIKDNVVKNLSSSSSASTTDNIVIT